MLKNYLKMAWRNTKKQKLYSGINLVGLSIGMVCIVFILLWLQNELSSDRFHEHADSLYRILIGQGSPTFTPLAAAVKAEIPEAVQATRYRPIGNRHVKYGEKALSEDRFCVADPAFFSMFSFPFVKGSPDNALTDPFSIVITEEMADKLFGRVDPMGEILRVEDRFDFKVSGVLKNIPRNSHLQFDILAPFPFIHDLWGENLDSWEGASHLTYVQLQKGSDPESVGHKISELVARHTGSEKIEMNLHPVPRLHLADFPLWLDSEQGSMRYVYLFSATALFILIIACINFLNLTTARSLVRAREVGIRKAIGGTQKNLRFQFLFESVLLAAVSLILALIMAVLLMPVVNNLLGMQFRAGVFSNPAIILGLLGITVLSGFISGIYPAFILSSFSPSRVLRGTVSAVGKKRYPLRMFLVVVQFSLTIILLIGASVVHKQMKHVRNYDLGFNKENVICMPATGSLLRRIAPAGDELQSYPGIVSLSLTNTLPGRAETASTMINWEGKDPNSLVRFEAIYADLGFQDTFGLSFLQGHYFSRERISELRTGIVVNEAAVRALGISPEDALGKKLINIPVSSSREERNGTIIGVVKDFHSRSLHNTIRPLILKFALSTQDNLSIRIAAGKVSETLEFLGNIWTKYSPDYPLNFRFLDDILNDFYRSEQRMGKLFNLFALIAIFTSCLGLFGLASNMAERRRKEIGIRKTLGASEAKIVGLLSKEILIILAAANAIALPASYYFMNRWLENFAFRTNLGWITFVLTSAVVIFIALGTVGYRSFIASKTNPVDSLRYE